MVQPKLVFERTAQAPPPVGQASGPS
jgi:hypothetical protein